MNVYLWASNQSLTLRTKSESEWIYGEFFGMVKLVEVCVCDTD